MHDFSINLLIFSFKMGWLTTDSCCCCISVRSGGLILGILGLLSGIFGIFGYIAKSDIYINQLAEHNISPAWGLAASGEWKWYFIVFIQPSNVKFWYFIRNFVYSDQLNRVWPIFVRDFQCKQMEKEKNFSFFDFSAFLICTFKKNSLSYDCFFLPLNRKRYCLWYRR